MRPSPCPHRPKLPLLRASSPMRTSWTTSSPSVWTRSPAIRMHSGRPMRGAAARSVPVVVVGDPMQHWRASHCAGLRRRCMRRHVRSRQAPAPARMRVPVGGCTCRRPIAGTVLLGHCWTLACAGSVQQAIHASTPMCRKPTRAPSLSTAARDSASELRPESCGKDRTSTCSGCPGSSEERPRDPLPLADRSADPRATCVPGCSEEKRHARLNRAVWVSAIDPERMTREVFVRR